MPTNSGPHPNVLILHSDQQRYDSLGCSGNPHAVTPHLDALAREATVFHRHIASNPICMPSRASLFSGRYPNGHGVAHNGVPLARAEYQNVNPDCSALALRTWGRDIVPHVPTLADVLGDAGYRTAAVGKLHLTPTGAPQGTRFEESKHRWKDGSMSDWHGPYYGFEQVDITVGHGEGTGAHYRRWLEQHFPEVTAAMKSDAHRTSAPFMEIGDMYPSVIPVQAHHSTWIAERVCAFLENGRDSERPFFLFAGFPDPHHPFTPPAPLADVFATHDVLPVHFEEQERTSKPRAFAELMDPNGRGSIACSHLPAGAIRRVRQYTDAMVHLIDRSVGKVLDKLKRLGLWENTIVIFTSDHGDFLGDHGMLRKSTLCSDVLTHVPFLMRAPGAGLPSETSRPMSNADVLPTLCDLTGISPPEAVQGRSILPVLRGGESHPVCVVAYHFDPAGHNFSMYDERYRFTWYPVTGERELYDHLEDPHELRNRAGDASLAPEEEKLFRSLLQEHCRTDMPVNGRIARW